MIYANIISYQFESDDALSVAAKRQKVRTKVEYRGREREKGRLDTTTSRPIKYSHLIQLTNISEMQSARTDGKRKNIVFMTNT